MNKEYKINKDYIKLLIDNKDKIIHLGENDIRILITYIDVLQQELQRKDNNWNELKKYVDKLYESETYHSIGEVLDKMEEIENGE